MIDNISNFFQNPLFSIPDGILKLIAYIIFGFTLIWILFKILFLSWRLWKWLYSRKIFIFASLSQFWIYKNLLMDSGIFSEKKLIHINLPSEIDKAKDWTVFLLDWENCKDHIDEVLRIKNDTTALIVHAKPWSIPHDIMDKIWNKRNTVVVNFTWRLLNDLLTSMVTTSYSVK